MSRDGDCAEILTISIGDILEPTFPARSVMDEAGIRELAASIESAGLLQPIGVELVSAGDYRLVFGSRRLAAIRLLGETEIRAVVLKSDDLPALTIIENLQRQDLSVPELALALCRLVSLPQWNQDRAARLLGKNKSYVSRMVKLGCLIEKMEGIISFTKLPVSTYFELLEVPELLLMAEDGKWTQSQARVRASKLLHMREARSQTQRLEPQNGDGVPSPAIIPTGKPKYRHALLDWLPDGFRIRSFTFRRNRPHDFEAVIERIMELQQRLDHVIDFLRMHQSAGTTGTGLSKLDFEAASLDHLDSPLLSEP